MSAPNLKRRVPMVKIGVYHTCQQQDHEACIHAFRMKNGQIFLCVCECHKPKKEKGGEK